MENKNIILIAIAILVVALVAVGIYSLSNGNVALPTNNTGDNNTTTNFINIGTINADDLNNTTDKVVGDNSTLNNTGNMTNNNTQIGRAHV